MSIEVYAVILGVICLSWLALTLMCIEDCLRDIKEELHEIQLNINYYLVNKKAEKERNKNAKN